LEVNTPLVGKYCDRISFGVKRDITSDGGRGSPVCDPTGSRRPFSEQGAEQDSNGLLVCFSQRIKQGRELSFK
jgi:hypothetical protein